MPARVSACTIYQKDDPVFVGVVSDKQWGLHCESFGLDELANDETVKTNNDRVIAKDHLVPIIQEVFMGYTKAALMENRNRPRCPLYRLRVLKTCSMIFT
jgi:crotonobetainyl-CoA:carnitine CoA-transferase CaiB-like acyl-CoA transferase